MPQLHLPGFEGPLDLLLQLIEQREFDISTIALAEVADQYLTAVERLKAVQGDAVPATLAEFLALGSRLMLLKSRRLLPLEEEPGPEDADDPGRELVGMLEEYRRYRDAVAMFGAIDQSGLRAFRPGAPPPVQAGPPQGLPDSVTLDLLTRLVREALARADARAKRHPEVALERDPVTVNDKIADLRARLGGGRRVSFRAWIAEARTRTDVIVTFMAILELYKSRAIEMRQDDAYGDIIVEEKPGAPPRTAGSDAAAALPAGAAEA